jgi:hypothetical protein
MSAPPNLWDAIESERRKRAGQQRSAARHAAEIAALAPIARELAVKAGPLGIIAADVRLAGVQRGILTGTETGRELSYLPAVMRAAGLVSTGQYRKSQIPKAHANPNLVHVAPEYARAA